MPIDVRAFDDSATLYVYGGIGMPDELGYEVSPREFVDAVRQNDGSSLTVRLATVGGDPVAAAEMYQALVDAKATVTTIVDSKAYSAGSLLLQAGDKRQAQPLAMVMVHAPRMIGGGTSSQLRERADALDSHAEMMIAAYTRHGIAEETARAWLFDSKDRYFNAAQALEAGLIDEVLQEDLDLAAMDAPEQYRIAAMGRTDQPGGAAMPDDIKTEGAPQSKPDEILAKHSRVVKKATEQGVKAESKRRNDIAGVFEDFYDADPLNPITALHDECMNDTTCDELGARRKLLAYLAGQSHEPILASESYAPQYQPQPTAHPRASRHMGGAMLQGRDQHDKRAEGLERALSIKAGLIGDRKVIDEERKGEFLALSLVDIMAQELRAAGYPVVGSREDIARRYSGAIPILAAGPSHGTDHLPSVLGTIANKSAMQGWESSPETWAQWTQSGTLSNYQTHTRANIALLDKLNKMLENQEWEYGDMTDVKQRITGYFYGLKYSLSIQAIVNDELGELTRTMQGWGEAASATVGDAVHALLFTSNTGYGQTMDEDSKACFHADHNNYIASGSGAAPSETTLNAGRTAMLTQSDPNGRKVAAIPRYLIHGPSLYSTVRKVLQSQELQSVTVDGATGATVLSGSVNAVQSMNLTPIEEYRLVASAPAATTWVLAASRRTVEVAGVGGPVSPRAEQSMVSNVPGITYELSMPFGAAVLDYRGLYFNFGA